ncbi:A24 family peptidase [Methanobrevibacter filiformis]|uniref:Type IV leader peptidase family protein n=1 Tax=Methanobrevibacter filiformis TaxID=55758 RepID=A0A166FDV4_9EURY|nr:A24 family peptidase [Methanobrevibacter filiformis]KZX17574.1 type IV leader peptidase family protein [Methanobrevibacter filiformis]
MIGSVKISILLISIIFLIIGSFIASVFDIKYGIIPNKLNFFLIAIGLIFNSLIAITTADFYYFIYSIVVAIIVCILSYILWKFRFWGGGDVKLLTAMALIVPSNPLILGMDLFNFHFPLIAIYPFPLTIFFNSIIISLPFLIAYLIVIHFKNNCSNNNTNKFTITNFNISTVCINKFNINNIKNISNIKNIFKFKVNLQFIIGIAIYLIYSLYIGLNNNGNISYSLLKIIFGLIFITIGSNILKSFLKKFLQFIKEKSTLKTKIDNLTEGMLIEIRDLKDEKIVNIIKNRSNNLIVNENYFQNNELGIDNFNIIYYNIQTKLVGIDGKDLLLLKSLSKEQLIENHVYIKIAVPFAPSLFLGLLSGLFIGDISLLIANILKNCLFF